MNQTRSTPRTVFSLSALALLITGALLYAGPLDPPAGPVTSTYKTLAEVEPRTAINAANTPGDADSLFKITLPGSYYLTGNITGVVGRHGIEIAASGVTLDLNGFDLLGLGMGAFDGVSVTVANLRNIAVHNGSIRNWGDDGIDLFAFNAAGCRVEGLRASGNADNGLVIGINSTVTNCSAYLNATNGIFTGEGCTITSCSANGHSLIGIRTGIGSTVTNCSAASNTGSGIGTSNGCTVSNCSVYQNTGSGISTGTGSTVSNCTAYSNVGSGILCTFACVIRGNACASNGNGGDGAGIHATGNDNRIEGNTCTFADRGIDVDGGGNIIIRNTCASNTTNWVIVAGNAYGPIVATPAGAAVNGNTAVAALGSTDPNANFTY